MYCIPKLNPKLIKNDVKQAGLRFKDVKILSFAERGDFIIINDELHLQSLGSLPDTHPLKQVVRTLMTAINKVKDKNTLTLDPLLLTNLEKELKRMIYRIIEQHNILFPKSPVVNTFFAESLLKQTLEIFINENQKDLFVEKFYHFLGKEVMPEINPNGKQKNWMIEGGSWIDQQTAVTKLSKEEPYELHLMKSNGHLSQESMPFLKDLRDPSKAQQGILLWAQKDDFLRKIPKDSLQKAITAAWQQTVKNISLDKTLHLQEQTSPQLHQDDLLHQGYAIMESPNLVSHRISLKKEDIDFLLTQLVQGSSAFIKNKQIKYTNIATDFDRKHQVVSEERLTAELAKLYDIEEEKANPKYHAEYKRFNRLTNIVLRLGLPSLVEYITKFSDFDKHFELLSTQIFKQMDKDRLSHTRYLKFLSIVGQRNPELGKKLLKTFLTDTSNDLSQNKGLILINFFEDITELSAHSYSQFIRSILDIYLEKKEVIILESLLETVFAKHFMNAQDQTAVLQSLWKTQDKQVTPLAQSFLKKLTTSSSWYDSSQSTFANSSLDLRVFQKEHKTYADKLNHWNQQLTQAVQNKDFEKFWKTVLTFEHPRHYVPGSRQAIIFQTQLEKIMAGQDLDHIAHGAVMLYAT